MEESQHLQEFYRDVEGELTWIREKDPMASSDDLGRSLTGVQNLLKKHQVGWQHTPCTSLVVVHVLYWIMLLCISICTYVYVRTYQLVSKYICTLKGTPNLYFLSEVLTISTGDIVYIIVYMS